MHVSVVVVVVVVVIVVVVVVVVVVVGLLLWRRTGRRRRDPVAAGSRQLRCPVVDRRPGHGYRLTAGSGGYRTETAADHGRAPTVPVCSDRKPPGDDLHATATVVHAEHGASAQEGA
ncbi:MAG: hypothetical protein ACYDES_02990 [Acidimicrobiales bacterium]